MKIVSNSLDKFSILPPVGFTVGASCLVAHTVQVAYNVAVSVLTKMSLIYFKCRKLNDKVIQKQTEISARNQKLLSLLTRIAFDIIRMVPVLGALTLLRITHNKVQNWKKEAESLEKKNKLKEAMVLYDLAAQHGDVESIYTVGLFFYTKEKNYAKAFDYFLTSAKMHHADSQATLAVMYKYGLSVDISLKQAIYWTKRAVSNGSELGLLNMGNLYLKGYPELPQSYQKAFNCFEKAAKKGNEQAYFRLGFMFLSGQGVKKDPKIAKKWFEKAPLINHKEGLSESLQKLFSLFKIENENSNSIYNIGKMLIEAKDVELGLEWVKEAALRGDLEAQVDLGNRHLLGTNVNKSKKEAYKFFLLAANQGHPEAQYQVGHLLSKGFSGQEKDITEALNWFKKAADQSHFEAQYRHAVLILKQDSLSTLDEIKKALEDLNTFADQGHLESQYLLATIYKIGSCHVAKNPKESFKNLLAAAKQEFAPALSEVGIYYRKGIGVDAAPDNDKQAFKYTKLAAEHRDSTLDYKYNLAFMYLHGYGTEKNVPLAMEELEKGVKRNHIPSILTLADLFRKGQDGIPKNLERSHELFLKAANDEDASASTLYIVGKMYLEGTGTEESFEDANYWLKKAIEKDSNNTQYQITLAKANIELFESHHFSQQNDLQEELLEDLKNSYDFLLKTTGSNPVNPEASYLLGRMFLKGIGVELSLEQALHWLEKSINDSIDETGHIKAKYYLQANYYLAKTYIELQATLPEDESCQHGRKAFDHIHGIIGKHKTISHPYMILIKVLYANMLEAGFGTAKDEEKAFNYYIEVGNSSYKGRNKRILDDITEARKSAGNYLKEKKGDLEEAMKWFKLGNNESCRRLNEETQELLNKLLSAGDAATVKID